MTSVLGYTVRWERRLHAPLGLRFGVPVLSVGLAFVVGAAVLAANRVDPLRAYSQISMVFLTLSGISQALSIGAPVLLIAVGLAIGFRTGFWNIGAEGQYLMGAVGATWIALFVPDIPPTLVVPLMAMGGFVSGAAWASGPALLKARLGVNEVLTTLMTVYIALQLVFYLTLGPWRDPLVPAFAGTAPFPAYARLPRIPGTSIDPSITIGILIAIVLYQLMQRSRVGFEIRVVGESTSAARYAGIRYLRTILLGMIISGGLAGLAGMVVVSGSAGYLRAEIAVGYGFTGIIVAWLAGLNTLAVIPATVLFSGLKVGADVLQTTSGVPEAFTVLFQAMIFIFVIVGELFRLYRFRIIRTLSA